MPAPGGPSSRVNLPGCSTVLMVSRIVKRCEVSLVKRVLRSTPYKTADRLMVSQSAVYQQQSAKAASWDIGITLQPAKTADRSTSMY